MNCRKGGATLRGATSSYLKCNNGKGGSRKVSINFKEVYGDRINQINKDIRKAINKKDWKTKAILEAEKKSLEDKITQMR